MFQQYTKVSNVKKIAILRANALGDFIVTLPAIASLKNTYPEAELVLLGRPWHKQFLLKGRTPIDRVIVVPVKKGIREEPGEKEDLSKIEMFINAIQEEHFDIVINFQGKGIAANPFIKRFNALCTIGFVSKGAEALDRSLPYYYYQNETLRFLELVQLAGAKPTSLEPEVTILESDIAELGPLQTELRGKEYIVLHPVAVDKRRMWPLENYPLLADHFIGKGYLVVFSGDKKDHDIIDHIMSQMNYHAINAAGTLSIGGSAAMMQNAKVVIGADTGPIHLARAVNTPTVGIYWAPNLINWGPVTRGIHRPVVSWNMNCSLCGEVPNNPMPFEPQDECEHNISFTRDISVEQVIAAAEDILSSKKENKQDNHKHVIHR